MRECERRKRLTLEQQLSGFRTVAPGGADRGKIQRSEMTEHLRLAPLWHA